MKIETQIVLSNVTHSDLQLIRLALHERMEKLRGKVNDPQAERDYEALMEADQVSRIYHMFINLEFPQ